MTVATDTTSHLKTQAKEFVKQYIAYDGTDRVEYVYTAKNDALNNSACSVVRYSYSGSTSRVVYMREYEGTWLTSWEAF